MEETLKICYLCSSIKRGGCFGSSVILCSVHSNHVHCCLSHIKHFTSLLIPPPPPPRLRKTKLLVIMNHWPLHSLCFEWGQSVERLYCKMPILCLESSKILTPHLLTARRLCTPRFWCGGRTHSLGGKGVGGQYFGRRQTLLCTLHTY